uniref:Uncharacterized protein n=1 Tax=Anguilla anguilla TaxID=7936 RepID=A0A0E9PN88_ANGAN
MRFLKTRFLDSDSPSARTPQMKFEYISKTELHCHRVAKQLHCNWL